MQAKPTFRAGASLRFPSFFAAARAVRALSQAGLYPANCRILDPREAYNTGAGDGGSAIMALAFESADHPLEAWMARALECCADHGGAPEARKRARAALWRTAFIRMPYAREFLTPAALIVDTFETAITWDRFEALHDAVKAATEQAIVEATGVKGEVTCRFTHVYPDGPAPYFSFHARGRHGGLLAQWRAIKDAAGDAVIAAGGTITHHHAVGRDHRPWYDRQRPDLFAAALARRQARARSPGRDEPRRVDRRMRPIFLRALALAPLIAFAAPAAAEDTGYGHLDFSRMTEPQQTFFWRRLNSLAVEAAVLSYCGETGHVRAESEGGHPRLRDASRARQGRRDLPERDERRRSEPAAAQGVLQGQGRGGARLARGRDRRRRRRERW